MAQHARRGTLAARSPSSPTDISPAGRWRLYKDGDNFLRTWVGLITQSKAWTGHSAIFITWDEGGFEDQAPFGPAEHLHQGRILPHPAL